MMEETVNKICDSLINEPEKWVFDNFTFEKKSSSTVFWSDTFDKPEKPITKIWNGCTTETVFTIEQGERIREAYSIARQKQASESQKRIIADVSDDMRHTESSNIKQVKSSKTKRTTNLDWLLYVAYFLLGLLLGYVI